MNNKVLYIVVIVILLLLAGSYFVLNQKSEVAVIDEEAKSSEVKGLQAEPTKNIMQFSKPPEMTLEKNVDYSALIKTSEGDITVDLFENETPITVNNFVFLAENTFYDGIIFHRVMRGFMIQGGDPLGTGGGGPGYTFNDEPFEGKYTKGTVAMANAGKNTNGSQFFIMHEETDLPSDYVIFGKVTKGIEIVDKIASAEVEANSMGELSRPVNPVTIETIEIIKE